MDNDFIRYTVLTIVALGLGAGSFGLALMLVKFVLQV